MSESTTTATPTNKGKSHIEYFLAFLGVIIPALVLFSGHLYKETESKRGIHEKYVELSIEVLSQKPDPKTLELRRWALNVLHRYSEVPIHEEAQKHMLENAIPSQQTAETKD